MKCMCIEIALCSHIYAINLVIIIVYEQVYTIKNKSVVRYTYNIDSNSLLTANQIYHVLIACSL